MELTLKLGTIKCYYSVDNVNLAYNENLKIEISNKTTEDYSLQFNDKIFKFVDGIVEIPYEFITECNKLTVITPTKKLVCPQLFVKYLTDGGQQIETAEQHFEEITKMLQARVDELTKITKTISDDNKKINGEINGIKKQLVGVDYFN